MRQIDNVPVNWTNKQAINEASQSPIAYVGNSAKPSYLPDQDFAGDDRTAYEIECDLFHEEKRPRPWALEQ